MKGLASLPAFFGGADRRREERRARRRFWSRDRRVGGRRASDVGWSADIWLTGAALVLLVFGYLMVVSVTMGELMEAGPIERAVPVMQLVNIVIALASAFLVSLVPMARWQRWGLGMLVGAVVLLLLVLVPFIGIEANHARRWLPLGPFNFQVSELVKLVMVLYLAGFLVRHQREVERSLRGLIKPFGVFAVVAGLLLLQPDFGASVVIGSTIFLMLVLAGAPLRWLAVVVVGLALVAALAVLSADYRLERVIAFIDPWAQRETSGYQLVQALIAIGRGEWFGVGLGSSWQKYTNLPEAHTDFIFAIIGEEFGAVGMLAVVGLFAVVVWRAFVIAARARAAGALYGAYVAYGLGMLIGVQAFFNIGVNIGLLPTKGLTLPLISYGGSSMVVNLMLIALILRVDRETRLLQARARREAMR